MRRDLQQRFASAVLGAGVCFGAGASAQQADLLSDPAVRVLVEEVLIADLMLSVCEDLIASEEGREEVQAIADQLALEAGYTPQGAMERLSQPDVRAELEAGARRRLAMMGARPEDAEAVCAVASRVSGRGGVLDALLADPAASTE
jgi:hypothetical protein